MLLIVPVAMLGAVGAYLVINPAQDKYVFVTYVTALVSLCALGGLEAGGLAMILLRERSLRRRLLQERRAAEKTGQVKDSHAQELQRRLDRLSAESQVYRASQREEAQRALEESLRVVREQAEAEEVSLFLLDASGQRLFAQALVDGTGSYAGEAIERRSPDDEGVSECFQHQSAFQTAEGDRLRLLVPLTLEGTSLGVLAATVKLTGEADTQAQLVEGVRLFLEDVAPHVASMVSTTILRTRALLDPLTGLYNRGHFDDYLEQQTALAIRRRGRDLSLVMIDLDHFKQINDVHGHRVGDEVLATVGAILKDNLRTYDTAYRYGGEELALILPETAEKDARALVERVRRNVKGHPFHGVDGKVFYVTLSAGIAQFHRQRMSGPEELVARADAALYRAKQGGRDRVALAATASPKPSAPRSGRRGRRKPGTKRT